MSSAPESETIGQRLKRLRLERGLSQRELASPGVSYAYISRIEAGSRQPSVKALRRLAAKLNISPEYLETGSDIREVEARELRLSDAELAMRLEDPNVAERALKEIFEEAVVAGDTVNATRASIALGFVASERGDHADAAARLESAIAAQPPSALERIDVYWTLGHSYSMMGHPERAVALFDECLEEVRTLAPHDAAAQVRYATALSYALSDTGDLARAESILKEALELAREHEEDPYMRVRLYWSLARLSELEGNSAAALHHIRRAIALLEATDDTIHLARAYLLCATIMMSQGNAVSANEQLDRAEKLLGQSPPAEDVAMLKVERARAAAAQGEGGKAVELAREAIDLLGDKNPAEAGTAFWALGEGLALESEADAANEAFRRSIDLLSNQRRWREATQACQSWGRMLRKAGREQQALDVLERASELGLRALPASAGADR